MTRRPTTVAVGSRLSDAIAILETRRISELPVLADDRRPVGLLDIVDVVGLVPAEEATSFVRSPSAAA